MISNQPNLDHQTAETYVFQCRKRRNDLKLLAGLPYESCVEMFQCRKRRNDLNRGVTWEDVQKAKKVSMPQAAQ